MDKLEQYRQIIYAFLKEQSEIIPVGGIIETETIFDRDSDRQGKRKKNKAVICY